MKSCHSYSSDETKRLGEDVARILAGRKGRKAALVVALQGDLGAGKTTFVQGFLKGLGVKRRAVSPTFVIMRRYGVKHPSFKNLHHVDAYRLRKPEDVTPLGFEKILADPQCIVLVEWPENINGALPKNCVKIKFTYGKKENERKISF
jgi:tRNA threonylcarbamoyladenosine biosynthesis protein TsaE